MQFDVLIERWLKNSMGSVVNCYTVPAGSKTHASRGTSDERESLSFIGEGTPFPLSLIG